MCGDWLIYGGLVVFLNWRGRLPRNFHHLSRSWRLLARSGAGLPSREGNQASAIRTQEPVAPKMGQERHYSRHDLREEELQIIQTIAAYCKLTGISTRRDAGIPVCMGSE